jgi:YVTN family beta-propeller protein
VIDVADGRVVRTIDLEKYHRPHGIAFLPDGKRVAVTAEQERKLLIVNVQSGEVEHAIDTDQDISHMVALSRDAKTAYVANIRSGSLSVIDLEAKELKKVIETGEGAEGVAVHPTRPEVWVSNRAADTVTIIDAESLDVVATLESPGFPIRVVFSQDGRHALVATARASGVRVFDAIERTKAADVKLEHELIFEDGRMFGRAFAESTLPIGILFHPDGGFAYVANTRSDVVSVIDTSNWEVVNHFKTDREPDGLGWSRRIKRGESVGVHIPAQ